MMWCFSWSSSLHVVSFAADEPSLFTVAFQDLPQGVRAADLEAREVEEVFQFNWAGLFVKSLRHILPKEGSF